MHELLPKIGEIAEKIKNLEDKRGKLGAFLKDVKDKIKIEGNDILEESLVHKANADKLENKKIIAIDGGLSQHAYHGIDLILTRAVAVIFDYEKGKLAKVGYHPHAIVSPNLIIVSDPYSDEEFIVSSSLERQRGEVDLAALCFKEFSPDIVLMDGSIVPHGNDRPNKNSNAWGRYESVIESFRRLYSNSKSSLLAGCVEDSRGRRFCEIISEKILSKIKSERIPELQKILSGTRDTNLLYHVLEQGERTCVFKYSKNYKEHNVLSDLGKFGGNIFCFYLKTAEFDRPVRIDFYCEADIENTREMPEKSEGLNRANMKIGSSGEINEAAMKNTRDEEHSTPISKLNTRDEEHSMPISIIEAANKISALVLATSCNSSYGFPAPLIEADFRAKLQEQDVDNLHDQLVDRVGITPSLMKLRRELRPF